MISMTERPFNNSNLFSNHYLEHQVVRNPEWDDEEEGEVGLAEAFDEIKEALCTRINIVKRYSEAELEEFLIRPIFAILGHHYSLQQKVSRNQHFPDYGFFPDRMSLEEAYAQKETGSADFYREAIAVGDAKRWTVSLDKKAEGKGRTFDMMNPSFQIDTYLRETPPRWAILTNGHRWRLYHQDTSYKLDSYYEVDLLKLVRDADPEAFKYFYLFFRREAFLPEADGRCFLDRVRDGSVAYARKIGDDLQENVYRAMKVLAEGFLRDRRNDLFPADAGMVQENALLLLYRLLFIFYAESRGLLDAENRHYRELSLQRLAADIEGRLEKGDEPLAVRNVYWARLEDLFDLINNGSEVRGIDREEIYIPAYNGGLFDPARNPFLAEKRIGDLYLARAVDLLARSGEGEERGAVDYSSLEIRHLGSIYEGLLEYKLRVAEEDLAAVKKKGKEVWIPKEEAGRSKVVDKVEAGGVYLVTDKGERKATGSYYTPDYIVKYIVEKTLEPIIEEKKLEWSESPGKSFADYLLSIKVLDPAMGSGHFLVEATDRLARALVQAWAMARPEDETEEVAEHDIHWARREVVRNCIYGVDLNLMAVELAKLSLWLTTVASNKPLSFLDHHLRCGNSLVGAELDALVALPTDGHEGQSPLWSFVVKSHAEALIRQYGKIAALPDDDLEAVKWKEARFREIENSELNRRLKEVANLWISTYFGNVVPEDGYAELQNELNAEKYPDWSEFRARDWFRRAQELGAGRRFFHWELEFPEVFFEEGGKKENPGWDAVVGNPPYVRQEVLGELKGYFEQSYETYHGVADLYVYFVELGMSLLRKGGQFSYIMANKWMRANYGGPLRRWMTERCIEEIVDFGDLPVFPEATTYPCILRLCGNSPRSGFEAAEVETLDFDRLEDYVNENSYTVNLSGLDDSGWSLVDESVQALLEKLRRSGVPLGEYVEGKIYYGIKTGLNEAFVIDEETRARLIAEDPRSAELIKPFLAGRDIKRYEPPECDKYLIFTRRGVDIEDYPAIERHLAQFKDRLMPKPKDWKGGKWNGRKPGSYQWYEIQDTVDYYNEFEKPKIMYLVFQVKPAFTLDKAGTYGNNAIWIIPKSDNYLLGLLNSKFGWFLISNYCTEIQNGYQLIFKYLGKTPIRRISFTTPEDERARHVSELKELYAAQDFKEILRHVDSFLPKSSEGEAIAEEEKSDVVHDLLAFLAEKMIEMNREKQEEITGFLRWLEGEIGAEIEALTNKTNIRAYYRSDFQDVLAILKKNKRKLSADPSRRKFQDDLHREFEDSMDTHRPLLTRIEETDRLIDEIVYKLYGLTDEEIGIVEQAAG